MRNSFLIAVLAAAVCLLSHPARAQNWPPAADVAAELPHEPGPIGLYYDAWTGRVLLDVPESGVPVLHAVTLSSGATWPIDRGTIRFDRLPALLSFRRSGNVVQVVEHNPGYGAGAETAMSQAARHSFPEPVVTTMPILARSERGWIVDGTAFLVRDAFGVGEQLAWVGETAVLDADRSAVAWPPPVRADETTDLDVRLTFELAGGSRWLEDRAPGGQSLTVVQRHVFFQIPDPLAPRLADERMGFYPFPARDFEERPGGGYRIPLLQRWRLDVRNGVVHEPIAFFIGPAVPERHRASVRRGVAYWQRTLEAAGFPGALTIEDLPAGADPYDFRFRGVFLWTLHRHPMASMANVVVDPRTGEVVKSLIHLEAHGPLVARNEYRAYRAALGGNAPAEDTYVDAYVAWTVAHELAHAIVGLDHTGYARSSVGFARPVFRRSGDGLSIDLGSMVPEIPLPYDVWSTRYAYAQANEHELGSIIDDGMASGLRAVDRETSRFVPQAVARITNPDVAAALHEAAAVRENLVSAFGPSALDPREPPARLYERFAPVYFHHVHELLAVLRFPGGLRFLEDEVVPVPIPAAQQLAGLDLVLEHLAPERLAVPYRVAAAMPLAPGPAASIDLMGEVESPGTFRFQTGNTAPIDVMAPVGSTFDPEPWARALSDRVMASLLGDDRAARMAAQHRLDATLPGLNMVLNRILDSTWYAEPTRIPALEGLADVVRESVLERLVVLSGNESGAVRTPVLRALAALQGHLEGEHLSGSQLTDAQRSALGTLATVPGIDAFR